jgi:small subunit ribosomal protein S15
MSITQQDKNDVIEKYRKHDTDVGSSEIQVAVLTKRILNLTEHFKSHKKDYHSQRGLLQMVGRRKRLLDYLRKTDFSLYKKTIESLGLRK